MQPLSSKDVRNSPSLKIVTWKLLVETDSSQRGLEAWNIEAEESMVLEVVTRRQPIVTTEKTVHAVVNCRV
jgi:hypothetical protein